MFIRIVRGPGLFVGSLLSFDFVHNKVIEYPCVSLSSHEAFMNLLYVAPTDVSYDQLSNSYFLYHISCPSLPVFRDFLAGYEALFEEYSGKKLFFEYPELCQLLDFNYELL